MLELHRHILGPVESMRLVCAQGVAHRPDAPSAKRDMETAKKLMATCIEMYTMQPTGIAPDFVRFPSGGGQCKMFNGANTNLQRPGAALAAPPFRAGSALFRATTACAQRTTSCVWQRPWRA